MDCNIKNIFQLLEQFGAGTKTIRMSTNQNNLDEYNDETQKQFQQPNQYGAG